MIEVTVVHKLKCSHLRIWWTVFIFLILLLVHLRLKKLSTSQHFLLNLAQKGGIDVSFVELGNNTATFIFPGTRTHTFNIANSLIKMHKLICKKLITLQVDSPRLGRNTSQVKQEVHLQGEGKGRVVCWEIHHLLAPPVDAEKVGWYWTKAQIWLYFL